MMLPILRSARARRTSERKRVSQTRPRLRNDRGAASGTACVTRRIERLATKGAIGQGEP
jgi:hypothetical protein